MSPSSPSWGARCGTLTLSSQFGDVPMLRDAKRFALPIAAISVLFLLLLFGLPFALPHLASRIGGVTERVLISSVLVWMLAVGSYMSKGHRPRPIP